MQKFITIEPLSKYLSCLLINQSYIQKINSDLMILVLMDKFIIWEIQYLEVNL